jgi:ribonuclease P protein component
LEVYENGRRLRGRFMVVFACAAHGDVSRLGITVTRKVGTASVRNSLRRRVREIFRRSPAAGAAPGWNIVVNVSTRAAGASFRELRTELEFLLVRAAREPA